MITLFSTPELHKSLLNMHSLFPQKMYSSSPHEIVLTSSPDGPITTYSTSSAATLARFTGSRSPRRGLALAGKTFIAASHISSSTVSGSIHLYNWWSSTVFHHLPLPEPVAPLAATADGSCLFAGGLSGTVYTLSVPSGNILKSFQAHNNKPVSCLEISTDGSLLVSGGDDGAIVVVPIFQLLDENSRNNFILRKFAAHSDSVTAIVFCLGLCNSTIVSCSLDSTCKFWSLLDCTHLRTVTFPFPIWGLTLDPTETAFYAAGSDGCVYRGLLKVESRKLVSRGRELGRWDQKHGGAVVSVAMVNKGRNLVSASEDGCVWLWNVEAGEVVVVLGNGVEGISDLVVARGIGNGNGKQSCVAAGNGIGGFGISGKELSRPVKETMDVENVLTVMAKDRRRAIDMLESAIGMYERLLELILKKARGGTRNSSEKEKHDM